MKLSAQEPTIEVLLGPKTLPYTQEPRCGAPTGPRTPWPMGVSGVFSLHPTWIPLQGGTRAVGAPMTTNLSAEVTLNEVFYGGALRERRGANDR